VWRITPAGDRALLVTIGTDINPGMLGEVLALDRALTDPRVKGLTGTVPAYASLLCRFDAALTDATQLEREVRVFEGRLTPSIPAGLVVDVPTWYEGPDLAAVARTTNLSPGQVVERHASQEYLVYCVGFAPGFTYCGELPVELAVPRLASPRPRVPAGSVAIAGRQTGIYAVASPGGWHLIGRTDLRLFDAEADPPARLKPGDRIRFVPQR
jgi:KipI family sensor histidine kinase inhibitor